MSFVRQLLLVLCTATVLTPAAWGQITAPRIVPAGQIDRLSVGTWARSLGAAEMSNRDYALRLLEAMTDPVTGCRWESVGPHEGADPIPDFNRVIDPVKLQQVFGWADEGQLAGMFVAVWEASGRGRGRLLQFATSPHVLAEIESDGVWWVFDVARRTAFPTSESEFATFEQLKSNAALWQRERGASFYEQAEPDAIRQLVMSGTPERRYDAVATGCTSGITLRRGERWIWFAQPQGNRWLLSPADLKNKKLLATLAEEPTGYKSADGQPLHANGSVVYAPDLTKDAGHFEDGVIVNNNLQSTAEGLRLQKDGVGWAIFSVQVPGPIVPELGKLEDAKDDKAAAVLDIDGQGLALSVSIDNAATWLSLEAKTFPAKVDLTTQVAGRYGYLLRVEVSGKAADVGVKQLQLTTWFQTSPRFQAAVQSGENRFQLLTNDEYGLPTRSFTPPISTRDENLFLAPVIRPPRNLQAGDATARVLGPFTMRVWPPLGTQLAWFSYGGRFAVAKNQPAASAIELGTAVSQPLGFDLESVPPVPTDHNGADRQIDRTLRFDGPAPAAYLRMEGRPALNDFRVTVHGLDPSPKEWTPWTITHRWREGDAMREHAQSIAADTTMYAFEAGENPVPEAVEFYRP